MKPIEHNAIVYNNTTKINTNTLPRNYLLTCNILVS